MVTWSFHKCHQNSVCIFSINLLCEHLLLSVHNTTLDSCIYMAFVLLGSLRRARFKTVWSSARFVSTAKSTIDSEEVSKFSEAAEDWWGNSDAKNTNTVGPLHLMNPVRVDYICRRATTHFGVVREERASGQPLEGLKILDIGCGGGILSESLARLGAQVTGIDASFPSVKAAKKHSSLNQATREIEYFHTTVEEFVAERNRSEEGSLFDIVCALEIIEHVADPQLFLNECTKLIQPQGCMFVSTLNRTSRSYFLAILMAEQVLKLVPPRTHDWDKFIKPEELERCLNEINRLQQSSESEKETGRLGVTDIVGMQYNPLTKKWYENKDDVEVNYIAQCAFLN